MRQKPKLFAFNSWSWHKNNFYKEHIEELKDISKAELIRRIYKIYKINEPAPGTIFVYFQNPREVRKIEYLGNGENDLKFEMYQPRLSLKTPKLSVAIENKDLR